MRPHGYQRAQAEGNGSQNSTPATGGGEDQLIALIARSGWGAHMHGKGAAPSRR